MNTRVLRALTEFRNFKIGNKIAKQPHPNERAGLLIYFFKFIKGLD